MIYGAKNNYMNLQKQITIDQLLLGEAFRRGNFTSPPTREIVEDYLEATHDVVQEYRVNVLQPDMTIIESVGNEIETITERVVYSKVHIDGILKNDYQFDDNGDVHKQVVSLLYAVDVQNPTAKVYTGFERRACLNLSVFNPRCILEKKFSDVDFNTIYRVIPEFIENAADYKQEYVEAVEYLQDTRYVGEELFDFVGRLNFKVVKIPGMLTPFTNMVKFLQSNQDVNGMKNIYFNKDWRIDGYTAFDLYQCMSATLSNKNFKDPSQIHQAYKLIKV